MKTPLPKWLLVFASYASTLRLVSCARPAPTPPPPAFAAVVMIHIDHSSHDDTPNHKSCHALFCIFMKFFLPHSQAAGKVKTKPRRKIAGFWHGGFGHERHGECPRAPGPGDSPPPESRSFSMPPCEPISQYHPRKPGFDSRYRRRTGYVTRTGQPIYLAPAGATRGIEGCGSERVMNGSQEAPARSKIRPVLT